MAKNKYGAGLDNNRYATSILQFNPGEQCAFCGAEHVELVRHEIYQGSRRQKCKELGLWITVCPGCHSYIHAHPADERVKDLDRHAQHQAMHKYGWSTEDFIREIGKNYI